MVDIGYELFVPELEIGVSDNRHNIIVYLNFLNLWFMEDIRYNYVFNYYFTYKTLKYRQFEMYFILTMTIDYTFVTSGNAL